MTPPAIAYIVNLVCSTALLICSAVWPSWTLRIAGLVLLAGTIIAENIASSGKTTDFSDLP